MTQESSAIGGSAGREEALLRADRQVRDDMARRELEPNWDLGAEQAAEAHVRAAADILLPPGWAVLSPDEVREMRELLEAHTRSSVVLSARFKSLRTLWNVFIRLGGHTQRSAKGEHP